MEINRVLALFPPGNREEILRLVLNGDKVYEQYMLYGVDRLIRDGIPIETNFNKIQSSRYSKLIESLYKLIAKKILGSHGELSWVLHAIIRTYPYSHIFAFSEKCLYPILLSRYFGFLKDKKIVLISIGLAEKLCLLKQRGQNKKLERMLEEITKLSKIITFSWYEQLILKEKFHLNNIVFIPLGVDTNIFKSNNKIEYRFDIVSVGADKNRDFELLIDVAKMLDKINFLLITNRSHLDKLKNLNLPGNIEIKVDIPMSDVCNLIDLSKIVFLPVKENLYSGATTCLLQAMSMSKAVVTSDVAPIRDGYGLSDKDNVVLVTPGDSDMAINELSKLLSNEHLSDRIGKNAREHVEKFLTLEKMVTSIVGYLNLEI